MTKQEAMQIEDLQIKLTPVIEDAFYFLSHIENQKPIDEILAMDDQQEKDYDLFCQASQHAGDRLLKVSRVERMEAIHYAYQMIDNVRKYGVACAEWAK
jgi:hypothetical protein